MSTSTPTARLYSRKLLDSTTTMCGR